MDMETCHQFPLKILPLVSMLCNSLEEYKDPVHALQIFKYPLRNNNNRLPWS